jgi:hypothetical protein
MPLIAVRQINQTELTNAIALASSGSAFSGNLQAYLDGSGWTGPNVVYTTGANQTISGVKTFIDAPVVPYGGATGTAASKGFVDNSVIAASGRLMGDLVTLGTAQSITGAKTFVVPVTVALPTNSGHAINAYYLSGVSGVLAASVSAGGLSTGFSGYAENTYLNRGVVDQSISGIKTFTGAVFVGSPTDTGHAVNLFFVSGMSGVLAAAGGGGSPNSVTTTGNEVIGGFKQFTGSPFVPAPTEPSGAVNLSYLSGVSGVLTTAGGSTNYYITGTGTTNITTTGVNVTNSVNVTSGTLNTYTNVYNNTYTTSTILTGNFYDISFFLDPVQTGYSLFESFVASSFYFTGASFACRTSGYGPQYGGIMTGKIYQVDSNNTEQTLLNFTFTSGVIYSGSPVLSVVVTGRNRVGLSLTNMLSGMEKFSVGIFGGGYA